MWGWGCIGLTCTKPRKSDMVVHTCNPSTWEVEKGESAVQGHYQLQSKLEA